MRWLPDAQGGGTAVQWTAPPGGGCTALAASSLRGLLAVVCNNGVYLLDTAGKGTFSCGVPLRSCCVEADAISQSHLLMC